MRGRIGTAMGVEKLTRKQRWERRAGWRAAQVRRRRRARACRGAVIHLPVSAPRLVRRSGSETTSGSLPVGGQLKTDEQSTH